MVDSPERGVPFLHKGLVAWAFAWAFLDAFSVGANDVANAFANAVGSQTVTHRQACIIACFGEFLGVMVLGKTVTDTVRKKMIQFQWFETDPYVLALGMSCVNLGSGLWVLVATLSAMPVSTTHAVVGAILGVGVAAWGTGGVNWDYDGGFLGVVASWFISPVMAAVLSSLIYLSIKVLILSHPDHVAVQRGILFLPVYFFLAFGIVTGFMLLKGAPAAKNLPYSDSIPVTIGVAVSFGILAMALVVPWTRRTIEEGEDLPWHVMFYHWTVPKGSMGYCPDCHPDPPENQPITDAYGVQKSLQKPQQYIMPRYEEGAGTRQPPHVAQPGRVGRVPAMAREEARGKEGEAVAGVRFGLMEVQIEPQDRWYTRLGKKAAPGLYMDVGRHREEDAALHGRAFEGLAATEEMFKMLQLTTCLFFSISHGANDIANALAPLATVWLVYSTGELEAKAPVPYWLLAYGAVGLDLGLVMCGHHIMAALGNRLTLQSPTRGFSIELGAMFTVMIFSRAGVPVSTTHCLTGATAGVGLCNGDPRAVNWRLLFVIFGGWLVTCPAAALMTGMAFWSIATSPSPMPGNGFFNAYIAR